MENPTLLFASIILVAMLLFGFRAAEKRFADPLYSPPELLGTLGTNAFVRKAIRFLYHFSTLIWWGTAYWLMSRAFSPLSRQESQILTAIHLIFAMLGILSLLNSRGREPFWPAYLVISGLCYIPLS